MLFNHERWGDKYNGPIGKWKDIKVEGDQITAEAEFDLKDEFGAAIASKVEDGFISACSIGLRIIETSEDPALMVPGQMLPTVTKCKIVECSVCDIPSNQDALVLYDADDKPIELSADNFKKLTQSFHKTSLTNPNTMELNKLLIGVFGLGAAATDAELTAKVQAVVNENKTLTEASLKLTEENKKLKEDAEKAHAELCDRTAQLAVDAKKIDATQKPIYVAALKADFEGTKKALDAIPAPAANLTHQLKTQVPGSEDRSTWTLNDWRKKDSKGLAQLKANDPAAYQALVDKL